MSVETWQPGRRLKNNASAAQRHPHAASLPSPKQQSKLEDDDDEDDKNYWGMERPTHLLFHHIVCTVILNKSQRETTGD